MIDFVIKNWNGYIPSNIPHSYFCRVTFNENNGSPFW